MAENFTQQIHEFLLQSQYFSAEQLRAQQLHQLEQLVRFARAEVPFYKNRLGSVFSPKDEFHFDHWHEVPVLKREDLMDHGGRMFPASLPPGHGLTADHLGSGTTGKSVTTRHNMLAAQMSEAAHVRAMQWHGIDFSKGLFSWFGGDPAVDRGPSGSVKRGWGPAWASKGKPGLVCSLSRLDPVEQALDLVKLHKPHYITAKPESMLELAAEAEKQDVVIRLEAILAFSSELTPAVREECTRVFGAKCINRYASKEVYDIAHQCPQCENLHICAEALLFEVLDENGAPCPVGQPGRAVVTSFYNTAQPIIRYDLGDIVTMGNLCGCGRSLPVITSLDGRVIHLFRRPNGKRFSLRLPDLLRKTINARDWQIAQTGLEQIEIRYLKQGPADAAAFDHITSQIRTQMTAATEVVFKPLEKLPATASGKVLQMVCEVPAEPS